MRAVCGVDKPISFILVVNYNEKKKPDIKNGTSIKINALCLELYYMFVLLKCIYKCMFKKLLFLTISMTGEVFKEIVTS